MIHSAFLWFRESLRHPEWIAAYALSIQILIFAWQAWILRRHAETLEKHTDIADKQEQTAKLIGQALAQQGTIMSNQLEFQKLLAVQRERKDILDQMVRLHTSIQALAVQIETMPFSPEEVAKISQAWVVMKAEEANCRKVLVSCALLSKGEWEHFSTYLKDVGALQNTGDLTRDLNQLRTLNNKHKDFYKQMIMAGCATPHAF